MLGKWLDRLKLAVAPGPFPVGLELGAVQACPLGDERLRAPRQGTGDYVPVQIDRRRLPGVTRVEMRAGVVGLVPVHKDRDAVEEADPGHPVTVRTRPEGGGDCTNFTTQALKVGGMRFMRAHGRNSPRVAWTNRHDILKGEGSWWS
jgi:hypothetical protein